ncbi:MAG: YihY/virulence factor BrkB family protein [Acidobacteriota bacterium]
MFALGNIVKSTVVAFVKDDCPSQAAALAYYTVFSLPPLLLIVIGSVGSAFGNDAVQNRVLYQFRGLVGPRAADQIGAIISGVQHSPGHHGLAAALGVLAIAFAATSAFAQLQYSLNHVWNVKPDPRQSEIHSFFIKRLISFGMILAVAFLMVASLLVSAALAAASDVIAALMPSGITPTLPAYVNTFLSLVLFAVIFAAIHGFLPDAEISWRDAVAGGIVTSFLFTGGKLLIGLYLGNSDITDVYGAVGSLAVILFWTYYSSMIVLLGAEFTKVWSKRHGRPAEPELGAMKVRTLEVRADGALENQELASKLPEIRLPDNRQSIGSEF